MGLTSRVGPEFATLGQMNVIWNTVKAPGMSAVSLVTGGNRGIGREVAGFFRDGQPLP